MSVFHRSLGLIRCLVIDGGGGDGDGRALLSARLSSGEQEIVVEDETLI